MREMKHTPGECSLEGMERAAPHECDDPDCPGNINRKKLEAYPDLLELAYAFLGLVTRLEKTCGETPQTKEYIQVAKGAIAKATE